GFSRSPPAQAPSAAIRGNVSISRGRAFMVPPNIRSFGEPQITFAPGASGIGRVELSTGDCWREMAEIRGRSLRRNDLAQRTGESFDKFPGLFRRGSGPRGPNAARALCKESQK